MKIAKLPLADRLGRLASDQPAYPEWAAAIVQHIANMPITSYMENCAAELDQLREILELTPEQVRGMTYSDMAARISKWYTSYSADAPQRYAAALRAVELLAAPLLREYQMCMPPSEYDGDFEEV